MKIDIHNSERKAELGVINCTMGNPIKKYGHKKIHCCFCIQVISSQTKSKLGSSVAK
jgi:hypothetical protein